jgi:hypothetical protein
MPKASNSNPKHNHIACALNNSMTSTSSALLAYMNLTPGLQGMIGSNKHDAKLAKHFILQEAKQGGTVLANRQ